MMLQVKDLRFSYGEREVLKGIGLSLEEGSILSILGPNAAGKSTLFRCVLGLLPGYQGHILLQGQDTRGISLPCMARSIAYIPQAHYPAFNYTVMDMVLMGTSHRVNTFASPGKQERAAALAALEMVGLQDRAGRDYMRISGGEQQLTLIARAIAQDSRLLVMDEPTASLDYGNQIRVMQQVRGLAARGYAILQATHNPNQAYLFSDSILAMKEGQAIAHGPPREVFTSPLIQALYGVNADVESLRDDCVRVCVPQDLCAYGGGSS